MNSLKSHFPWFSENEVLIHPKMRSAMTQLEQALQVPNDGEFIAIVGPAGCGKTILTRHRISEIETLKKQEMERDRQYMPAVYWTLKALNLGGRFNWQNTYVGGIAALNHPVPKFRHLGEAREKWDAALKYRRPDEFFIDEAGDFISAFNNDSNGIRSQANILKSLFTGSATKFVLVGTYDLLPLLQLNGQFARRADIVHVGRYRNDPVDRALFKDTLKMIDDKYGDYLAFSAVEEDKVLYDGCVGAFGLLCRWLNRAAGAAINENAERITLDHLTAKQWDAKTLLRVLTEAQSGETKLDEEASDLQGLGELLRIDLVAYQRHPKVNDRPTSNPPPQGKPKGKRKNKSRPGRLKPGGTSYHDPDGLSATQPPVA